MPFIPNPFFEKELAASAELKAAEHEIADKIVDRAKAIAPVVTGNYRDSIHVEDAGEHPEVVADALNDEGLSYAAYVEFGTFDTPAQAVLRRALESAE